MGLERTEKEVAAEIAALELCKTYIPKETIFGDDNIRNVDLQIEYLKGEIDTTADEFLEYSENEQSAILEAEDWLEGNSNESPSSGWDDRKPEHLKKSASSKPKKSKK